MQVGSEDVDSGLDSEAGFDSEGDSDDVSQDDSQAEEEVQPHSQDDALVSSDEDDVGDLSWEAVMAAVQGGGSDAEEEELPAAFQPDTTDVPERDQQGPVTAGLQKKKGSKDSRKGIRRKQSTMPVKIPGAGGSRKHSRK